MDKISVIVPCFNEEEVLPLFYKEVVHTLEKIQNIDYEILLLMMVVKIIVKIYSNY